MEAYGKSLISGYMALPAFQRRYGTPVESSAEHSGEQHYEISPAWQMGLQNAAIACETIGLLAHGYVTYVIGYRKMLIICLLWLMIAVFPSFFAANIAVLAVGQALSGNDDPLYNLNTLTEYVCRTPLGCYPNAHRHICG
jgi:SP family general alpha glucoside:H+ symporter-like MFS transporter